MHEITLAAFADELEKIAVTSRFVTKMIDRGTASPGSVLALAEKLKMKGYPQKKIDLLRAAAKEGEPGALRGLM